MRRISRLFLLAVCFATSSKASSIPNVFARACATSGFLQCSGAPADFCCGSGTNCIALAGNTTILCCPSGSDCTSIQPVSCDLQAQNNTLHPDNALKTTALTGTLVACGSQCCPFGYACDTGGNCVMNADQSKAPTTSAGSSATSSNAASSAATPASTSQSTTASTSQSSTTPISTSPAQNPSLPSAINTCDKFPAPAILVGFFPGVLLGILLTLLCVCVLGARRRNQAHRHSSDGSSFGTISEPQPSGADMRTDFLRKPPQTPSTVNTAFTPQRHNTVRRMKSFFRKSGPNGGGLGSRTMPGGGATATPPIPMTANDNPPVTPVLQREPSYENINIFADGDTASALRLRERQNSESQTAASGGLGVQKPDARQSHQTTFSDMLERSGLAGLQKGQPYVYRGNSGYETPSPPRQRTP